MEPDKLTAVEIPEAGSDILRQIAETDAGGLISQIQLVTRGPLGKAFEASIRYRRAEVLEAIVNKTPLYSVQRSAEEMAALAFGLQLALETWNHMLIEAKRLAQAKEKSNA